MITKTLTINLFKFDELSESAKDKVIQRYLETEIQWKLQNLTDEFEESLMKFAKALEISMHKVYYGFPFNLWEDVEICFNVSPDFADSEMTKTRFNKWLINNFYKNFSKGKYYSTNGKYVDGKYTYKKIYSEDVIIDHDCILTGVIWDHPLINAFMEEIKNWSNRKDTLNNHFNRFLSNAADALKKEWENQIEEREKTENIIYDIREQDLYYLENGELE